MKPIRAKISEVLDILRKNRDFHEQIFLEAQKIYRSEVIRKLDKALQDARDGKEFPSYIQIPAPENHKKDYDRVIRMLELSVDEVIELAENEVEVYIMDKWSWSHGWAASNFAYLNNETIANCTGSNYAVTASYALGDSLKTMQDKLTQYL